ncbi:MAG: hypothetical protein KIS66_08815 [Fimbriimonadaceae bacterium]|nr:hypothetical protein [Fimbriimonadaceae bacterium]
MKTTLELPDALMREVKIRSARRGTKLKDEVADLLRRGLNAPEPDGREEDAEIVTDELTGLPVIVCVHPAAPGRELTPDRIASVLMEQEIDRFLEAG